MPCKTDAYDFMEESESHKVAVNLSYVLRCLGQEVSSHIRAAADDTYGSVSSKTLDEYTDKLCSLCKSMTEEQQNKIIYDGRNKSARLLAEWWEIHQRKDRLREEKEREDERKKAIKKQALAKLTPEEIEVLELEM